jgi:predicted amidohydrolase YtcJ
VTADLVLRGGRIWDQRDLLSADSIAIASGRILAVGSAAETAPLVGPATTVLELGGRRVIPGLIDSHIHMVRAGTRWARDVRWEEVPSLAAALERIRAAARTREPGGWITVLGGWHPGQFEESRVPTRAELDEAAPSHPVYVQRGYVEAFLNTAGAAAMELPPDGDGYVGDLATLQACNARLPKPDLEEQVAGSRTMLRDLNALGVTGAVDAGGFGMVPEAYRAFFELWRRGERGFRTRLLLGPMTPGDEPRQLAEWARFVTPGFGDDHLRYLGAGEVLLYGAHDMEGVDGRDISGELDRIAAVSAELAGAGWPAHAHAILDSSVGAFLDAWERVDAGTPLRDLRYTITHAEAIGEHNLQRIRDLGIGLTIQHRVDFRARASQREWGDARMRQAPPLRDMIEAGIPMGAGTDATVAASYRPWRCVWWMVSGGSIAGIPPRDERHRLSRDEALRAYTSGSAWFSFEEQERGNLRPGSHADLAVLSADVLAVPEDEIPGITSELTLVGGAVVHDSGALPASGEGG